MLFAERHPCLPTIYATLAGMEENIARLGRLVRERREELGLSQEDIARLGGPSTTTLSKIENGTAKQIRRRTAQDLDRALGWRIESTERVLFSGEMPRITSEPSTSDRHLPRLEEAIPADEETDASLSTHVATDSSGRVVIVGRSITVDLEGVRSVLQLFYWPGDPTRVVQMGTFAGVVGDAHRAAIDATSIYRTPAATPADNREEMVGNAEHPAPTTDAGPPPLAEVVGGIRKHGLDELDADSEEAGYFIARDPAALEPDESPSPSRDRARPNRGQP